MIRQWLSGNQEIGLNSDVFNSVIDFDWHQIVEEYKRYKQVEGLEESSIYEVVLTLRHYERLVGPSSSKDITQQSLDTFASLLAQKGVSAAVTQRLLEHSSPQLTNDVYTNIDPVCAKQLAFYRLQIGYNKTRKLIQ